MENLLVDQDQSVDPIRLISKVEESRYPQKNASVEKNYLRVKPERTGWRDGHLSERHRKWGLAVPAVDLDFLLIEYDKGRPSALIEYKSEFATPQFPSHPSYLALSQLGERADLPVFAVRYAQNFSWWKVTSLNLVAKKLFPARLEMNEREFVTWLYEIRGLKPPAEIFEWLETAI
jgi:hypothetical protein